MPKPPPELFALPFKEIARICRVSEKTVARWRAGQTVPPAAVLMIIAGDLGCFHPTWRGWRINARDGELVSPEGWCITMADVRATPLQRQQIAIYQSENRRLKEDLQAAGFAQDQPLPDAWGWDLSAVKVQK